MHFLETTVDRDLVCEIGYHQGERKPITMKQVFLLGIGSVPSVQRRLRRLRHLGAILRERNRSDKRVMEMRLAPRILHVFARYEELISSCARPGHSAG